jgi:hypothetical protein
MTCFSSCFSDQSFTLCLRQRSNLHRLIGSGETLLIFGNTLVSEIFEMLFTVSILRPSLTRTTGNRNVKQPLCRLVFASPTADMPAIRVEIKRHESRHSNMNPLPSFNPHEIVLRSVCADGGATRHPNASWWTLCDRSSRNTGSHNASVRPLDCLACLSAPRVWDVTSLSVLRGLRARGQQTQRSPGAWRRSPRTAGNAPARPASRLRPGKSPRALRP